MLHAGRSLLPLKEPNGAPFDPLFVGIIEQVLRVHAVIIRHATSFDLNALSLLPGGLQEIRHTLLDIPQFR